MSLINTDGLVIFGAGSEWFWSMAQFVLVAITIAGIVLQLRAQAAANTLQRMQFFIDQWESAAFSYDRLATALLLRKGPVDAMEPPMLSIAGFFESLGLLERRKHISRAEIFLLGRSVQMWWGLLSPAIVAESARQEADLYGEFRRLAGLMREMDAKVGENYVVDAATIPAIVENVIRLNRGDLLRARALAANDIPGDDVEGVVATASAGSVPPDAPTNARPVASAVDEPEVVAPATPAV